MFFVGATPSRTLYRTDSPSEEFLGANIFDDNPFIVMPLLSKGSARDYVQSHPKCNRVRLVSEICRTSLLTLEIIFSSSYMIFPWGWCIYTRRM